MIRGLLITHGELGRELLRVVEMVMGPVAGLEFLSNADTSLPDLSRRVAAAATAADVDGLLVFTDDFGGSCTTAARLALRGCHARVLTGVNLAMLLEFAAWRDELPLPELAARLVRTGREAVSEVAPAPGEAD